MFKALSVLNMFLTFCSLKPYVLIWFVLIKKREGADDKYIVEKVSILTQSQSSPGDLNNSLGVSRVFWIKTHHFNVFTV